MHRFTIRFETSRSNPTVFEANFPILLFLDWGTLFFKTQILEYRSCLSVILSTRVALYIENVNQLFRNDIGTGVSIFTLEVWTIKYFLVSTFKEMKVKRIYFRYLQ